MRKKLTSCVLPGVALVLTRLFRFRNALIREDLPTFERPEKAIWGRSSSGNCFGPAALVTNSAERIFMGISDCVLKDQVIRACRKKKRLGHLPQSLAHLILAD